MRKFDTFFHAKIGRRRELVFAHFFHENAKCWQKFNEIFLFRVVKFKVVKIYVHIP